MGLLVERESHRLKTPEMLMCIDHDGNQREKDQGYPDFALFDFHLFRFTTNSLGSVFTQPTFSLGYQATVNITCHGVLMRHHEISTATESSIVHLQDVNKLSNKIVHTYIINK